MRYWIPRALEMQEQGCSTQEIADALGITRKTIWNGMSEFRQQNLDPESLAEERVAHEKEELLRKREQRVLTQLTQERARTDIICDTIRECVASLPEVEYPQVCEPMRAGDPEHAVLMISDSQIGQEMTEEETGGLGVYGIDVFRRYRRNLTDAVRKIASIHKQVYEVPVLNVLFLGDLVDGDTIYRGHKNYVDADVVTQAFTAADEFSSMLVELAQDYQRVNCFCVMGNHGRVGMKGEHKLHVNWDYIVYRFIEERLRDQTRISMYIPKSWWALVDIMGWKFLCQHGDTIRAWNQIPYYGLNRADARWTQMLAARDITYQYFAIGHHHNATQIDSPMGEQIINGAWPSGSLFSYRTINKSNIPSQWYFGVHPRKGITWRYKIRLMGGDTDEEQAEA